MEAFGVMEWDTDGLSNPCRDDIPKHQSSPRVLLEEAEANPLPA